MAKKPDKLAQDVSKAIAAKMSYGKWKAMQEPVKLEKQIPEGWLVCEYCGRAFKPKTKKSQRFCEVECQKQAYVEKKREYMARYRAEKRASDGR